MRQSAATAKPVGLAGQHNGEIQIAEQGIAHWQVNRSSETPDRPLALRIQATYLAKLKLRTRRTALPGDLTQESSELSRELITGQARAAGSLWIELIETPWGRRIR